MVQMRSRVSAKHRRAQNDVTRSTNENIDTLYLRYQPCESLADMRVEAD